MSERRVPGLSTDAGVPVPLKAVEIEGEIVAPHATLRVRQRYVNVEKKPIEAIYVFPLPAEAAVVGFAFESGGRRVEGVVREREEAFKRYDEALVQGHGAALLDQERDDVFTCSVGNVNPGEEATIEIEVVARTEAAGEALRLKIPTLVAPRYIPGAAKGAREGHGGAEPTDRVPDADRISPQIAEVDYQARLSLAVHAGEDADITSPSHAIAVEHEGSIARVSFAAGSVALDRDLVLRVEAGESSPIEAVVAHREGSDPGYAAITFMPDLGARTGGVGGSTLSVAFVVDRSGSMDGASIVEARRALRLCLRHLREGDRFSILAFDDRVEAFSKEPVPLTAKTLAAADRWIESVDARGGTELLAPMLEATRLAKGGGVVVLLTDGQVGNEDEIAKKVLVEDLDARIYSFGIGTNVSDALLRKLARGSGGAIEQIHPGERIDEKVVAVFARAIARRVRALRMTCDGVELDEIAPSPRGALPDLVDGEPLTIFARYARPGHGRVELRGTLDGAPWMHAMPIDLPERASSRAIARLWARERIRDFEDQALSGRRAEAMRARIVALGVEHGLATRYTSFVAIEKREGDRVTREAAEARPVPVSAPAGWAMFARPQPPMQAYAMPVASAAIPRGFRAPPGAMPPPPPAPAPAMMRASAPMRARSSEGMAKKTKGFFSRIADAFSSDDEAPGVDSMSAGAPAPMEPAEAAFDAMPDEARFEAARETGATGAAGDAPMAIMERQLVSGLWDDAHASGREGGTDVDLRRARATIDAIAALLAAGVTTAHPMFGEPLRKAIEALIALLPEVADETLRAQALALAWLCTEGKRARKPVRAAIDALAPALAAHLDDEARLRADARIAAR